MITFLGIIIFAIPFTSLILFKDKVTGFFSILSISLLTHIFIGLLTQSLHLFVYWINLSIYSLISLGIGIFVYHKEKKYLFGKTEHQGYSRILTHLTHVRDKMLTKQNFLIAIAFVVIVFNLASVHYNFSGTTNSYIGSYEVENSPYLYPYFSDEWAGIAFANYVIDSHSLPIVNPLNINESFKNPLVPYFSMLSDIFLFSGLSPLHDFELLNLLVGLLTCVVFFSLLVSIGVDKRVSALTALIIPYITNGGNLPGIWFLIPMTFALPFYLISLTGFAKKDNNLFYLASLLTLFLYPPFIVFVAPVLLVRVLGNKGPKAKLISLLFVFLLVPIIVLGPIVFYSINPLSILGSLLFYFFRTNLVGGYLSFPIWVVLPIFALPFALFGVFLAIKRRLYFILLPLVTGLTFWLCYIRAQRVFIIDYPRVVVITSFLILIFFGLFLDFLAKRFVKDKFKNILTAMCILIAAQLSFEYTQNDSWKDLMLHSNKDAEGVMLRPAPTASRFLTEDDLVLFSGFTKLNFISPPWKGLVISAATGNYPLATKPSTVGVFTLNYDWFVDAKCSDKDEVSIKNNISYVYSRQFDCANFLKVGESSEGLILYKFIKNI